MLNVALGVLKLLATYGRKAFALFDVVRGLLSGQEQEDEEDDGTVQVYECVADPVRAQAEADMEDIFRKVGTTREVEKATELEWCNKKLDDKDATLIAAWLKGNTTVKKLECAANLEPREAPPSRPKDHLPSVRFCVNAR